MTLVRQSQGMVPFRAVSYGQQSDAVSEPSAGETGLPPTIKDGSGREYKLKTDPQNGAPYYEHVSQVTAPNGNRLDLNISLYFLADGGMLRKVNQKVSAPNGDTRQDLIQTVIGKDGLPKAEQLDSRITKPGRVDHEVTTSVFSAGKPVRKSTDLSVVQEQYDPASKTAINSTTRIHAEWGDGQTPISQDAPPASLSRSEDVSYKTDGGGINKDTPRIITTHREGAMGTDGKFAWVGDMQLIVRFDGRGGQYLEIERQVPMDAAGNPIMARAKTIRTDDKQNLVNKGMMQARIWGGFAGNLLAIAGSRMLGGSFGGVGKALVGVGIAATGAAFAGEAHAAATQRNDASMARLFMTGYDTAWMGLYGAYLIKRRGMSASAQINNLATGAGLAGLAGNATVFNTTRRPGDVEVNAELPKVLNAVPAESFATSNGEALLNGMSVVGAVMPDDVVQLPDLVS